MRYYIFRHGQTFATKAHTGYGIRIFTDNILPEGIPEIERIGRYLKTKKIDIHVSSEVKRCRQTSKIVSDITDLPFTVDKRLNEYFIETFGFFRGRITSFLQSMEKSGHDRIAVCTHGAVIAGLTALLTKGVFEPKDILTYPDPGKLIIIEDKKQEEIDFITPI